MAGNETGLDTDWGQGAATRLGGLEGQFAAVFQKAKAIVAETPQHWRGNDCRALMEWFDGQGKQLMDNVTTNVDEAKNNLTTHTRKQTEKSRASSTVGTGG